MRSRGTFLLDSLVQVMDLPENPYLSPHIHYLHAVYTGYVRPIIKGHLTRLTMHHLDVSEFQVEGFPWKFVSWTQRIFRINRMEYVENGVRLPCFTQFYNYVFSFVLGCLFKHSLHFNSINVTSFILRWWCILCAACGTVWSAFGGWVCSRWLCGGCVCFGIVWLWLEGITWLLG